MEFYSKLNSLIALRLKFSDSSKVSKKERIVTIMARAIVAIKTKDPIIF